MSIPYANATTGTKAREEISKVLHHFGCESIGFMDDYEKHEVLLAFTHLGARSSSTHRRKVGRSST